jgi:hypothetical protein
MGTEEAMATAIVEMLETNEMKTKTLSDLDDEEICYMALLQCIAKQLKVKEIQSFVDNFCQFRVSRNRLGRREMGSIVSNAGSSFEDRLRKRGAKDLFAGLRG